MLRGEVWMIDLDPARTGEADKRRPAVIVSNDGANHSVMRAEHGVVTVVPVTSSTRRIYPFQVRLPAKESGLTRDSKAQAEQIRAVSIDRVSSRVGRLSPALLLELDEALRLHLSL